MTTPTLLNDDGTASIATCVMMSHHGFRRDLQRFERALVRIADGDVSRRQAVAAEWQKFRAALHGHHEAEDSGMFPNIASQHESARGTIAGLEADHRQIDPLLERGDAAFANLSEPRAALDVVTTLLKLLTPHLATEERELIPYLRLAKTFPAPLSEEAAKMYAEGFAWAMHGVAPRVVERVHALLPETLLEKLPTARAAFAQRYERVWGVTKTGASETPIPDDAA
jgi:hemerythrin-like domain-containing protein